MHFLMSADATMAANLASAGVNGVNQSSPKGEDV
jgi:hypothetical protein